MTLDEAYAQYLHNRRDRILGRHLAFRVVDAANDNGAA